ncbi:MAG: diguanylate cyclase (GGDEF)-like protein [Verrucomicrobiales bacterium]|jgi:diguanylate cyclase (GGDEF)-like protein
MNKPDLEKRPAHILLLDDEKPIRAFVAKMLETMGHTVSQAANLSSARNTLASAPIEVVLCDITLLEESGLDLLHELAPRSPDIVVVMMTGNNDTQTAIDCLRSGAFDYLIKPMTTKDIKEVVTRVIERQRNMRAERERIEEQLHMLGRFSSENPNPVLRVGDDCRLLYANDSSVKILEELDLQVGDKLPDFLRDLTIKARTQKRATDFELENSGRYYVLAVTPIRDADYVYLYGHDISELKMAERELTRLKDNAQRLALYDGLTQLPNRALLDDRFQHELERCKRNGTKLVVAFIDLDRFKQVNDTQGHKAGDQLLICVAKHLQQCIRKSDTVARWGGDEFILLLPGIKGLNQAKSVCEGIKARVQKRMAEEDGVSLTMSMGAAIYPDDGTDPDQLLQSADAALLMVKTRARNEVIFYSESPELASFRESNAIRELLSTAVSEGRIQVHYQPIIDAHTGGIVGAEALARWHEDAHGWISPGLFIPLAESMGLIDELGRSVRETALRYLQECHRKSYFISLSINVSLRELLRAEFTRELLEKIETFGLVQAHITLELTESQALLGIHSESARLEELAAAGFHLSVDDFGQGHSSLASLHEMPVEELKIDMKFVQNLHTEKGQGIVQAIEELSRILKLETVAEGVETKEQERVLQDLGITRLQGYLYSRPLAGDDFLEFLEEHGGVTMIPGHRGQRTKSVILPS